MKGRRSEREQVDEPAVTVDILAEDEEGVVEVDAEMCRKMSFVLRFAESILVKGLCWCQRLTVQNPAVQSSSEVTTKSKSKDTSSRSQKVAECGEREG